MTSSEKERPQGLSPVEVWEEFVDMEDFKDVRPDVIPCLLEIGQRRDVLVLSGENASGKSLAIMVIGQLARSFAKQDKYSLEVMDIGMGRRTQSGIVKGLMFGDEGKDSTGNISIKVMQTAIKNSRERDGYHYLILDEPDIGVGEGYHNAIGAYLAEYAASLPEKCLGFVVATHSRRIAEKLLDAGASSLRVGEDLRPVREWVRDGDIEKSVEDLLALKSVSRERASAVRKMLGT